MSTSNLTFFLRTAGLVVPSINAVKTFKLPGYLPSTHVIFYVLYFSYALFFFSVLVSTRLSLLLHFYVFLHLALSWNSPHLSRRQNYIDTKTGCAEACTITRSLCIYDPMCSYIQRMVECLNGLFVSSECR